MAQQSDCWAKNSVVLSRQPAGPGPTKVEWNSDDVCAFASKEVWRGLDWIGNGQFAGWQSVHFSSLQLRVE